jgi:hypothetical protein
LKEATIFQFLKEVKNKDKMVSSTKLDEKLEGPDNFKAWKHKISLVLEENHLSYYVMEEVAEPEEEEAKGKYKKNLIRAKRIIEDSIKDHLIPHVSSLKTPKEMFDALSSLYEGRNINRQMALRFQLKNLKMQKYESIHSFFTRVSQINEQIIAIGDSMEEVELVMTTLNGLLKSSDSFIRGIVSRSKLTKFSRLWEDCVQEEAREEKLSDDEDQALAAHFRKGKKKKENHPPKKKFQKFEKGKRDYSKLKCFCCEKLRHLARDCPLIKEVKERRKNKRRHAHIVEDDEPIFKRKKRRFK